MEEGFQRMPKYGNPQVHTRTIYCDEKSRGIKIWILAYRSGVESLGASTAYRGGGVEASDMVVQLAAHSVVTK